MQYQIKAMKGEKVSIQISKDIYEKAKKFVGDQGGFSNVEELVEFLLSEVLSEEELDKKLTKEEEERVKKRLRSLGYF